MTPSKAFPVPVVAFGPGSQPDEAPVEFMPMPSEMSTYAAPALPEPEVLAAQAGALDVLQRTLAALRRRAAGGAAGQSCAVLELGHLGEADRGLLNQVLGEGEVAAQLTGDHGIQAQESVFAGVWRVVYCEGGAAVRDTLEIGAFPRAIAAAARGTGQAMASLDAPWPADTMNAPAVLQELRERALAWRVGDAAHVVNLSLLPLSAGDIELFEQQLGSGPVLVLSRGYGNCRIVNTCVAGIWRVTYFNSQDMIILDTLEVGEVPEVACAAPQDLEDSAERLHEVLQWVEAA
jgi:hydrogenase-1 operon protein HyaF